MFDVIYSLYEDDVVTKWVAVSPDGKTVTEAEAKSDMRSQIYAQLFDKTYRYPVKKQSGSASSGNVGEMPDLPDVPPEMKETKPYFPPTDPESFADAGLDAPLG